MRIFLLVLIWCSLCLSANAQKSGLPVVTGIPALESGLRFLQPGPNKTLLAFSRERQELVIISRCGNVIATSGAYLAKESRVASVIYESREGAIWVVGWLRSSSVDGNAVASVAKLRPDFSFYPGFNPVLVQYTAGHSFHFPLSAVSPDGSGGAYVGGLFDVVDQRFVGRQDLLHVAATGQARLAPAPAGGVVKLQATQLGVLVVNHDGIFRIRTGDSKIESLFEHVSGLEVDSFAYSPEHGLAVAARSGSDDARIYLMSESGAVNATIPYSSRLYLPLHKLAWDNSGRLLACGSRTYEDNGYRDPGFTVLRLLRDGTFDPSWSRFLFFDLPPSDIVQVDSSRYLVSGAFDHINGIKIDSKVYLTVEPTARADLPANHSARGRVQHDSNPLILGFVIPGDLGREVLIRALGPSLQPFGVAAPASEARLRIYRGDETIANIRGGTVDSSAHRELVARSGAIPLAHPSAEPEWSACLLPGAYTVVIDSSDTGEILGEVFMP